ncbi:MAG: hypothetical protein HDKAJFGB_03442 [Anaerolineae bacterium]|nr:hypothetical protein [Anaerolineae bacterium]
MNRFLFCLVLALTLSACAQNPRVATTPTLPVFSPVALAQTTNAPTPTADPRHTRTPTSAPSQTLPRPTQTAAALPPPTLSAPTALGQIELLNLPGEGRAPEALAQLKDVTYVANRGTQNLTLVKQDRAARYLDLGMTPWALAADAAHNRIYVGTSETPTLMLIENEQIAKQVPANARVNALAVADDNLYVARDDDAVIERYDANTLTKKDELKLPDAFAVNSLVLDAPRNRLYAGIYEKIVAIDLAKFQELFRMAAPGLYGRFAVNPHDGSIWSGAYDGAASRAFILGYSPEGQEIARLPVASSVAALTFDDANRLYALDRYGNQLFIVQTPDAQVVATLATNQAPSDAVFDAQTKRVIVSNAESNNLAIVDTATANVTHTIPLAVNLNALAANPERNRVYAANGSTNSIFVVEDDHVIAQIPVGNNPVDLAVDPATNRLYAAADADGTLTVIDEATLRVVAQKFISSTLNTVAIDSPQRKLFAGSYLLDPATLEAQGTFFARGLTLGSKTIPQFARVNPALSKLYALASNGVPGSNSRVTLYRFLYDAWDDPKLLGSGNGGNTTALALDPTTNNVYAANTHPLAYNYGLDVFDAQDQLAQSLVLNSHTADMVVNPETHHLFLAHPPTALPALREPKPEFNTVEILDTRTLGHVATLQVSNAPWRLTRLGDKIYVAGQRDGVLTILGDAAAPKPPAPTPTLTPTPFPTWTPAPNSAPTATLEPGASVACSFGPPPPFAELWLEAIAKLGCPTDKAADGNFAVQTFKDGYMFDDLRNPNAQKIYVLLPDKTFAVYDDTWREGDTERPCNDVPIPAGRIHPKRGFGKVWCEHPEIQSQMPGAVADEAGIPLTVQDFERGMMWANTPRGVITLFQDGTWQ